MPDIPDGINLPDPTGQPENTNDVEEVKYGNAE